MRIDEQATSTVDATGLRIAVVTSRFNATITKGLEEGALAHLATVGADVVAVHAPGAFELPLIAQAFATSGFDAVVCLGAVVEGETDHYEHVAHRASEGLMQVQLATGVPVAFGILTVRDAEHALARSVPGPHNKGAEAAAAAVETALTLATVGERFSDRGS